MRRLLKHVRKDAAETRSESELWDAFKNEGDLEARNQLVQHHMKEVFVVLKQLRSTLPILRDELDDVLSDGTLGLITAVDRFRPETGNRFSAYARYLIRGHIFDGMRTRAGINGWVFKQYRAIQEQMSCMERVIGRIPTPEEVAEKLEMRASTVCNILRIVEDASNQVSFDEWVPGGDPSLTYGDVLESEDPLPSEHIEFQQDFALAKKAVMKLSRRERRALILRFGKGLKGKEVGELLSVGERQANYLATDALKKVQRLITEGDP